MPCRDYYDDHPEEYYGPKLTSMSKELERAKKQISFAESALCAALNALTKTDAKAINAIDFNEAGITKKALLSWWKNHMELDKKHRRQEEERRTAAEALAAKKQAEARARDLAEFERLKRKLEL